MAQVTVNRHSAELGKLPGVCLCCGRPAQRFVRHQFYYDPLWLAILGPLVLGVFRYIWAAQNVVLTVPVCASHGWRLKLPTYVAYGFACSLFGMAPVLLIAGQTRSMGPAMGWFFLLVFLYVIGMLLLMVIVRLASPRMVDFEAGTITFGSVSQGFADAVTGRRMPTGPLSGTAAMPGQPLSLNPHAANSMAAAYPRAPATNNGPLIALIGIGGGVLVLVLVGCLTVGLYVAARVRRDAVARAMHTDAEQKHKQLQADAQDAAQVHHEQVRRDIESAQQRATTSKPPPLTASPTTASPTTKPAPTQPAPTTSLPSAPTSSAPSSSPIRPGGGLFGEAPAASPNSPAPSGNAAVPDPFASGAPPISAPVGIPPRPRPDRDRDDPHRFASRKNVDKEPGPDGNVEEVYSPSFQDSPHPPDSRPLTRVADLKAGAQVWVQSRGRSWVRSTVLSVERLRAKVHYHGSDSKTDELVAIPKIRLATDADALASTAAAVSTPANPFDQTVPPRKRTWTDASGKFSIDAEFVKLTAGKVTLKRDDGTEITLALDKLAESDQQIARQLGEM